MFVVSFHKTLKMIKQGTIVVRTKEGNLKGKLGKKYRQYRELGSLFKTTADSKFGEAAYSNLFTIANKFFRLATEIEIEAYNTGVRNINGIKKLLTVDELVSFCIQVSQEEMPRYKEICTRYGIIFKGCWTGGKTTYYGIVKEVENIRMFLSSSSGDNQYPNLNSLESALEEIFNKRNKKMQDTSIDTPNNFFINTRHSPNSCRLYKDLCKKYNIPHSPSWLGVNGYYGIINNKISAKERISTEVIFDSVSFFRHMLEGDLFKCSLIDLKNFRVYIVSSSVLESFRTLCEKYNIPYNSISKTTDISYGVSKGKEVLSPVITAPILSFTEFKDIIEKLDSNNLINIKKKQYEYTTKKEDRLFGAERRRILKPTAISTIKTRSASNGKRFIGNAIKDSRIRTKSVGFTLRGHIISK